MSIHVGCCGFPKARAEYYKHFSLVEIQQTFYKPPRLETAARWRADAPADFEFALKAWQAITHPATSPTYRKAKLTLENPERYGYFQPTDEVFAAWDVTQAIAQALHARLILFQCPASFTPTRRHREDMRAFFGRVDRAGATFLWEPRGKWDPVTILGLCEELDLIHVVDPFAAAPVTSSIAYFRLHGVGGYRYRYTDEDLRRLLDISRSHDSAYCLFNNITMWEDALRLRDMLGALAA